MRTLSRRTFSTLVFALLTESMLPRSVFAYDDRKYHNEDFEATFFGKANYKLSHGATEKEAIEALESAIYLCIDQVQEDGVKDLERLADYGVPDLPVSVAEINPSEGETKLSGTNHHYYTHRGWTTTYKPDKANWLCRKKILLNTVEKVFDFSTLPNTIFGYQVVDYDKRCDAFAALAYYVHILGDYVSDDKLNKFNGATMSRKLRFARKHPADDNSDLFYEIEKYLGILFEDQRKRWGYARLINDLKSIARDARNALGANGEIDSEEKFQECHMYAEELLALLKGVSASTHGQRYRYKNRVHKLLKKEDFFGEVFT